MTIRLITTTDGCQLSTQLEGAEARPFVVALELARATPPDRSWEIARALQPTPDVVTLAAAHMSNVEQPDAFNRALLGFLS